MTEETTRAYPLYWPESWPRTEGYKRKRARFDDRSVYQGRRVLSDEVRRFGGTELIISSNLELRLDGNPRSNQRQPSDPGVAIFFKRDKVDMALACDVYMSVEDNLWALCRTLEALRQIERDGSPALINRAFKGFKALPDPDAREWWEELNISRTASTEEIRAAYISLAKQHHPDAGGDTAMFQRVVKAFNLAIGKGG
jgi:hypothetical protein